MQREPNESYEAYRTRRAAANKAAKIALQGALAWDSGYAGVYTNPEKKALKAERAARKARRKGLKNE